MFTARSRSRSVGVQNSRVAGFTLIELLVVIAIIAILAAILFPVFSRARENARRASCSSNMKQIALGVYQYIQDYDERYPLIVGGTGGTPANSFGGAPYGWASELQPYLKSTQILQCPSEVNSPNSNADTDATFTDYYLNTLLNSASGTSVKGVNSSILTNVSGTVLMGEGGNSAPGGTANGTARYNSNGCGHGESGATLDADACTTVGAPATLPDYSATGGELNGARRHLEGSNFAFADGHVKWLKGKLDGTSDQLYSGATTSAAEPGGAGKPTFALQ